MLILSTGTMYADDGTSLSRRKDANSQHIKAFSGAHVKSIKKEGC